MVVASGPFPIEALETNRNGQLTDAQRRGLGTYERSVRKSELTWALIALAFGAIILFVPGFRGSSLVHFGVPFVCVLVAAGLVAWSVTGSDPLAHDLRKGKVVSLQGPIGKRRVAVSDGGRDSTSYFLDVGDKAFHVRGHTYDAAPDAGHVRIYYLPRSRHVVNLERMAEGPVPDLTGPRDVLHALGAAVLSTNRVKRNEAKARIQAMSDQMESQFTEDATPPPEADSDARPLAQAIVGTWHNMMMTITFHADGKADVTLGGGTPRTGEWSVDAEGRLSSDVMGQPAAVDARVIGDQLTLAIDGRGLTFHRTDDASA